VPKLKILYYGFSNEDICDLDQAGYLFDIGEIMIMVAGQKIASYDSLVKLISQDRYKDKQYVEVVLLPAIAGG
jgi:hypothetical protein